MHGKVVIEFTILPDGTVDDAKVVKSNVNNDYLEKKLVSKVRELKFESKDVSRIVVRRPYEFLAP